MNQSNRDAEVFAAAQPHLEGLGSEPDIVGSLVGSAEKQYFVKVLVTNVTDDIQKKIQGLIPSPLEITLDDGEKLSLPVHIEETGMPAIEVS